MFGSIIKASLTVLDYKEHRSIQIQGNPVSSPTQPGARTSATLLLIPVIRIIPPGIVILSIDLRTPVNYLELIKLR